MYLRTLVYQDKRKINLGRSDKHGVAKNDSKSLLGGGGGHKKSDYIFPFSRKWNVQSWKNLLSLTAIHFAGIGMSALSSNVFKALINILTNLIKTFAQGPFAYKKFFFAAMNTLWSSMDSFCRALIRPLELKVNSASVVPNLCRYMMKVFKMGHNARPLLFYFRLFNC